jgi:hypothetical protein
MSYGDDLILRRKADVLASPDKSLSRQAIGMSRMQATLNGGSQHKAESPSAGQTLALYWQNYLQQCAPVDV